MNILFIDPMALLQNIFKSSISTLLVSALLLQTLPLSLAGFAGNNTPGTNTYPNAGMAEIEQTILPPAIEYAGSVFTDDANDLMYRVSATPDGGYSVVKSPLKDGETILGTVFLPNITYAWGARMRADGSKIYVADYCNNATSSIYAIDTATMQIDGELVLAGGPCIASIILDENNDIGYFMDDESPTTVYKVDLSLFNTANIGSALTGTLTLNAGDDYSGESGMLNSTGDTLYLSTWATPLQVVTIDTATMTRTSAASFPGYIGTGFTIHDELINGKYYTISRDASADPFLLEIDVSTMTIVDSLAYDPNSTISYTNTYSPSLGRIYSLQFNFSNSTTYYHVVDVATMSFVSNGTVNELFYTDANQISYLPDTDEILVFSTHPSIPEQPMHLYDGSTFALKAVLPTLKSGDYGEGLVLDTANGFGYVYVDASGDNKRLTKINLDTHKPVASLTLPTGYHVPVEATPALDIANNRLYLGLSGNGGGNDRIQIVDLSTFTYGAFSDVTDTLNRDLTSGAVDAAGELVYFGSRGGSRRSLFAFNTSDIGGSGSSLSTLLVPQLDNLQNVAIDNETDNVYVTAQDTSIGRHIIMRFNYVDNLGSTVLQLNAGEVTNSAIAIDQVNKKLYVGLENTGSVVKIDLNTFSREGILALPGAPNVSNLAFDPANSLLYATTYESPAKTFKISTDTFTSLGSLTLSADNIHGLAIDTARGKIFTSSETLPAVIDVVKMSQKNGIYGTKLTLGAGISNIDAIRFYSHEAAGNLRLAIYDAGLNKVWESNSFANTKTNAWVNAQVANGTPNTLASLAAGDYWLTFQTDSNKAVASYSAGAASSGFYAVQNGFNSYPATLSSPTFSTDNYAMYLVTNAGFTLTQSGGSTNITEGGATDSYTIVLNAAPASDVTYNMTATGGVVVAPTSLTFTNANWNAPQTVTVSIPDDAVASPNRTATISHTVVSALDEYVQNPPDDITVYVRDAAGLPAAGSVVGITSPGNATLPNEGLLRTSGFAGIILDDQARVLVFDPSSNKLAYGNNEFVVNHVDAATLEPSFGTATDIYNIESRLESAVMDEATGFAYFATKLASPTRVLKVRMIDGAVMEVLHLAPGEVGATQIALDKANDALFVVTHGSTPTKVVKVQLSTFTRVGTANLPTTINDFQGNADGVVIDSANQMLYIGDPRNTEDTVYKVNTATMSYVGSIDLGNGLSYIERAFPYAVNGFAYFLAWDGSNGVMVRVRLSDFTYAGHLVSAINDSFSGAVFDPTTGLGYALSWSDVIEVFDLENNTYIGQTAINFPASSGGEWFGTIDTANQILYIQDSEGYIQALDTNGLTELRTYEPRSIYEGNPSDVVQDEDGDYLYVYTADEEILKFHKDTFARDPNIFDSNAFLGYQLTYDQTRDVIYVPYQVGANVDTLVRVDTATMAQNGSLFLGANKEVSDGVVSADGTVGYFITQGSGTVESTLYKVDLATFTIAGSIDFPLGTHSGRRLVYDAMNDIVYAAPNKFPTSESVIYKIDGATMSIDTSRTLSGLNTRMFLVDGANGLLYIERSGTIFKLDSSDLSDISNSVGIEIEEPIHFNSANNTALVGMEKDSGIVNNGIVAVLDLDTLQLIASETLLSEEDFYSGGIYDVNRGEVYSIHEHTPFTLSVTSTSLKGNVWGTKINLAQPANLVDSVRFYVHDADGNYRVSIYDANFQEVWQSNSMAMGASNTWYNIAISDGTPNALTNLPAGDYYLAFQTDSTTMRPGYSTGPANSGFYLRQTFGTSPSDLTLRNSTNRNFSMALTIDVGLSLMETDGTTSLVEGGASDSYEVVLNSQPGADVTIQLNVPAGVTASVPSITFTPNNWNIPQSVILSAPNNTTTDGNRNVTLTHTIVTTDPYYFAQNLRDITIGLQDPASTPAPAPTRSSGGGGGGFSAAPNTLGAYMQNMNANTNTSATPSDGNTNSNGVRPAPDTGTTGGTADGTTGNTTQTNTGISTAPRSGPLMNGEEISLCEIQRLNLLSQKKSTDAKMILPVLESSNFRKLILQHGLVLGTDAEATNPFGLMTRSEILRLVLQTQCGAFSIPKAKEAPFPDVSMMHEDALYVLVAKVQDIVSGYLSDGTFKPDNDISRAESLKIVLEVLFRSHYPVIHGEKATDIEDVSRDAWYYRYVDFAAERGIIPKTAFKPDEKATREDIATFLIQGVKLLEVENR